MMYTSGCPKSQNKCAHSTGLPPPVGSKKFVLKFLSNNSIVNAAANTGNAVKSRIAVVNVPHTNNGACSNGILSTFILHIVTMKFIAPNKEDTPATWSAKIAKSTDGPE